jgi:hypothetical protein
VVPFAVVGLRFPGDGSCQLTVTGAIGHTNSLYYSPDLINWTLLSTGTNTTGTLQFIDEGASGASQRYYEVESN